MMQKHLPLIALAAINALSSIVVTYALLRAYDALFAIEPNPATVIWSAHIALFWRLAIGAYVAGMVSVMAVVAGRRNLQGTIRVTAALVPVAFALIALQGALLP